ncbi:MAG TPA: hypothetical protein VKV03_19360 [Candidatus Binataceae bacterium]|nr:hypothetical protein [Candidatus Binataceae bacterium]
MKKPARAQRLDFFLRTIRPCSRSAHFRIFLVAILKLSGRQPVEPGRMLIQQSAGLEMQFTAEQFAYRAFHAREIRIIGLRLASPIVAFFAARNVSFRATLKISWTLALFAP